MRPLATSALSLLLCAAAAAQSVPGPQQQRVLALTNQDRVLAGLQPLAWDPALAAAAAAHAQGIAARDELTHQLAGEPGLTARAAAAGAHFAAIAENIAYGPSPDTIEREWMRSPPHRANILDPHMNAIGIGLVASAGTLWAVEDFASAVDGSDPGQVAAVVARRLSALGLAVAAPGSPQTQAARAACPHSEGAAGAHARLVVHWESAHAEQLPQPLAQAAASGQYTLAAVAVCAATNNRNAGFTVYRAAVLLF